MDELITSYSQDEHGNCTSIAFTKAVLDRYGSAGGMFGAHYKRDDTGVSVQIPNGTTLTVTEAEIAEASAALGVRHRDGRAFQEASVLFALLGTACAHDCASAKQYCSPIQGRNCTTYSAALQYLNGGLEWDAPPKLLGLQDVSVLGGSRFGRWRRIVGFTRDGGACVAATPWHTYYVAEGSYDRYGHRVPFTKRSKLGFEATNAYCLGKSSLELEDSSEQDDRVHQADEMAPLATASASANGR